MKYTVFTPTACQSDFNICLTFIGYNHYIYGSKNLTKLISQNSKSLVSYVLKTQVYCCYVGGNWLTFAAAPSAVAG